jgi:dolichyl-phosphate-mannose-protein mannosyltransferase
MTGMRPVPVAVLLALFALQVHLTARQTSPAFDEVGLLSAGYVFVKTGLWNIVPEHPPLIPALAALPLLALQPRLDMQDPNWTQAPGNIWKFGPSFLFSNDADRLLWWGRLSVLGLALTLGYFVYRWARDLYGTQAGVLALLLYAFCPTIVAHSGFISHDVGLACFSTLSLYWLWRFMRGGGWPALLWTGGLLGCALATKASAVLLPPLFAGLMLVGIWSVPGPPGQAQVGRRGGSVSLPLGATALGNRVVCSLGAIGVMFAIATGVLYTVYLFPTDPLFYVKPVLLAPNLHQQDYPYYLMGEFRPKGWWYYFLIAFLIKTPIPMLLLIPLAAWHWWSEGARWFPEGILLVPALAFFVLISMLADPLGVRYLVPIYPLLFVFVSRTAPLFTGSGLGRVAGIVLATWYLLTPIRIHPDYLAYFNELAGGSKHGIEYLDDSNIDWGQNLRRLKRYLDSHPFDRVKLLYFGMGRPEYYGIQAQRIELNALGSAPVPGIYIISANALVRARAYYKVDWLERYRLLDVIGYSFYVFKVDGPATGRTSDPGSIDGIS